MGFFQQCFQLIVQPYFVTPQLYEAAIVATLPRINGKPGYCPC